MILLIDNEDFKFTGEVQTLTDAVNIDALLHHTRAIYAAADRRSPLR